jgi:hypothetical protein
MRFVADLLLANAIIPLNVMLLYVVDSLWRTLYLATLPQPVNATKLLAG